MNKNDSPVLYDLISIIFSLVIIGLTVIELIDYETNYRLFPYIFLIGGIWSAFGMVRNFMIHRKPYGLVFAGITILLLGISVSGFVWR